MGEAQDGPVGEHDLVLTFVVTLPLLRRRVPRMTVELDAEPRVRVGEVEVGRTAVAARDAYLAARFRQMCGGEQPEHAPFEN